MANSLVLHSASRHYDLLAWILTLGREQALRERLVDLARLQPGETVLDVGCGTGSLAVTAKRRVGPTGSVRGIDASLEMIEQARAKAARAGIDVSLDVGRAEALPCPDGSVDVVLSTLMMHHLPRSVREAFAAEIHRVLKPGGRVLVVDFEPPAFIPHIADSAAASVDAAAAGIIVLLVAHLLLVRIAWPARAFGSLATLGVLAIVAIVAAHGGAAGGFHALLRKHRQRR